MNYKLAVKGGIAIVSMGVFAGAHAQSSNVQLYGNLDVGITYISNLGGKARTGMGSGASRPSRFGLRGSEDLGNGLKAIFVLEAGVNAATGAFSDTTTFFGREASVGLQSKTFGTLKMGRMTDFFFAEIGILDSTPLVQGGMTSGYLGFYRPEGKVGPPPPVSLHYPGPRYDNTVKWFQNFGPLRVGLMYGFGNINSSSEEMYSAMIRYEHGGFAIGAGYTKDNYTNSVFARRTYAVKAQYRTGKFIFFGNYGVGKADITEAENRPLEIGFQYAPTEAWRVGAGIGYAWARDDDGRKARIRQPFVGVKYFLSKRTELYAMAAFNHTSDRHVVPATVGSPGGAPGISSSSSMNVVRFGINHMF